MVRYRQAFRIFPGEELRRLVLRVLDAFPDTPRAARLLNHYQRRRGRGADDRVPEGANDDLVDAVGTGVTVFLGKKRTTGVTPPVRSRRRAA
jgi:hypothetical protein